MPDFYVKVSIFLVLVLSVGLHEAAHAKVATFFGDPTPEQDGVNTWNPIPHILRAFMWCVVVPAIAYFGFGFFIGGAFVMLNPALMRPRKLGYFCAVAAGPGMNLALAIALGAISLLVVKIQHRPLFDDAGNLSPLVEVLMTTASFNFLLMVFNLIPIPPLDGSAMAATLIPGLRQVYNAIGGYGFLILILALNFSSAANWLLWPVQFFSSLLVSLAGGVAPH